MIDFERYQMRKELLADLRRIVDGLAVGAGHVIMLNDYQVANLRAAIQATGYASVYGGNPLSVLNNGDWIGELYQMLPYVELKPNLEPDEMAKRANEWRRRDV